MQINKCIDNSNSKSIIIIILVKQIIIFMSYYTNMQYERNVSSVDV